MTDARKGKPARKKTAAKNKAKAAAAKARPRKAQPKPKAKPGPEKTAAETPPPGVAWEQAADVSPGASIGDVPPEADAPAPAAQAARRSRGFLRMLGLLGFLVVIGIGVVLINWPFWAEVLAPYWSGGKAEPAETPAAVVPAQPPMTAVKVGESVEEMRTERQQLRQELNRLMARMESIEKSVDSVKKLIQVTASVAEKGNAGKISAALAERLSELEDSGESIKSLLQRMDKLESASAAQIGAEPNARAGGGQSARASSRARAIVLAVANLRQAVAMDEPFEKPLEALSALSGDDPDIKSAVLVLSKSSVAGIPTLATLRERFDGLAGKIVQASKTLEETGWMERATNRIMSLVTWRRVGARAGVEASSPDAIVAGAEVRLRAGDLKGAVKALEGLSSHAKAARVAATWMKDAKSRVFAERAVATLHIHAVSLLAPGKE